MARQLGFAKWSPPVPFGSINIGLNGKIHWTGFRAGLDTALALGFLYMIRCSLHGTALKKNVPNLRRKVRVANEGVTSNRPKARKGGGHRRIFSEAVDIEHISLTNDSEASATIPNSQMTITEQASPTKHSLNEILFLYGISQYVCAVVGSFGITPSVAASSTMYTVSLGWRRIQQ